MKKQYEKPQRQQKSIQNKKIHSQIPISKKQYQNDIVGMYRSQNNMISSSSENGRFTQSINGVVLPTKTSGVSPLTMGGMIPRPSTNGGMLPTLMGSMVPPPMRSIPQTNMGMFPPTMFSMIPMGMGDIPQYSQIFMKLILSPFTMLRSQRLQKYLSFVKCLYVTGFQKTVTKQMLMKHFQSYFQIDAIKLPISKFNQNKNYAFIYYSNKNEANFTRRRLNRTKILLNEISVTKAVIKQDLVKIILKINKNELTESEINQVKTNYFNEIMLEKQIQRIIQPIFGFKISVNKIIIPKRKQDKRPLDYARLYLQIQNVKQVVNIVRRSPSFNQKGYDLMNEYQIVQSYINKLLNAQEIFRKYAKAQIYKHNYFNKQNLNVLHLMGITHKQGENMSILAEQLTLDVIFSQQLQRFRMNEYNKRVVIVNELIRAQRLQKKQLKILGSKQVKNSKKDFNLKILNKIINQINQIQIYHQNQQFINNLKKQWEIKNCFASEVKNKGVWANITFASNIQAMQCYKYLKTSMPAFRGKPLYATLKNLKELRTVIFSQVNKNASNDEIDKFLQNISKIQNDQPRIPNGGHSSIKNYQYYSYNVIEQKYFYLNNQGQFVSKLQNQTVPESWRLKSIIPKRLVVFFCHDIIKQKLLNDLKYRPDFIKIFGSDEKHNHLKVYHQKGHYQNMKYVKHQNQRIKRNKTIIQPPVGMLRPNYNLPEPGTQSPYQQSASYIRPKTDNNYTGQPNCQNYYQKQKQKQNQIQKKYQNRKEKNVKKYQKIQKDENKQKFNKQQDEKSTIIPIVDHRYIKKNTIIQNQYDLLKQSSILANGQNLQKLVKFFPQKINRLVLLYKGSEHNFKMNKFYQKCGNVSNNIILCQSTKHKILGGYTALKFNPISNNKFEKVTDPENSSFCFSITNNDKFQLLKPNEAIYRFSDKMRLGFGGMILYIEEQSNKILHCQSFLGGNMYMNKKYQNDEESYLKFNGNKSQNFQAKEWEVFKVEFQQ